MGLFQRKPLDPIDEGLAEFVSHGDRGLAKIVSREQGALLGALGEDEAVVHITRCEGGTASVVHYDAAVVVTNRRLLIVRKHKIESLDRADITKAGMPYQTDVHKHRCIVIAERQSRSYMVDIEDRARASSYMAALGYLPG